MLTRTAHRFPGRLVHQTGMMRMGRRSGKLMMRMGMMSSGLQRNALLFLLLLLLLRLVRYRRRSRRRMLLLMMMMLEMLLLWMVMINIGSMADSGKVGFIVRSSISAVRRRGSSIRRSSMGRLKTRGRGHDVQVRRVIGSNVVRVLLRTNAHAR